MGAIENTEDLFRKRPVTIVNGQLTYIDVTKLMQELEKMAASVPTASGGEKNDHLGLVMNDTKYKSISHNGVAFPCPTHPGVYPVVVSINPVFCMRGGES